MISQYHNSDSVTQEKVQYDDIFSDNIQKQKQITELFEKLLDIRDRLMSSLPVACTGPVQSNPILQNHSVLYGNKIYLFIYTFK